MTDRDVTVCVDMSLQRRIWFAVVVSRLLCQLLIKLVLIDRNRNIIPRPSPHFLHTKASFVIPVIGQQTMSWNEA